MVLARRRTAPEVGAAAAAGAPLLLLALLLALACCAGGNRTTAMCGTVRCGMGQCSDDVNWPLPYECVCNPGWSQPKVAGKPLVVSPCFIPDCPLDPSCFNLSLAPPGGIPFANICVAINCGDGGECKGGGLFNYTYTCDCHPGYVNFLNLTMLPCVKPCSFGTECSKLGVGNPPPSPSTAAPPPGAVSSWLILLLATLAMVQVLYLRR